MSSAADTQPIDPDPMILEDEIRELKRDINDMSKRIRKIENLVELIATNLETLNTS